MHTHTRTHTRYAGLKITDMYLRGGFLGAGIGDATHTHVRTHTLLHAGVKIADPVPLCVMKLVLDVVNYYCHSFSIRMPTHTHTQFHRTVRRREDYRRDPRGRCPSAAGRGDINRPWRAAGGGGPADRGEA